MKRDPKDFIFQIDSVKPEVVKSEAKSIICYDSKGRKINKKSKDVQVFLKIEDDKHYVRINRKYRLCNPYDTDSLEADKKLVKGTKQSPYTMVLVDKECFEHYSRFLTTTANVHIKLAQRYIDQTENKVKGTAFMTKAGSELNDELRSHVTEINDANT